MNYTIGYIDFETCCLKVSENLYTDISVAAYDLNFTISEIILKKYDILLRNSFLFVCKDELSNSFNNLKISRDNSIIVKKTNHEIDIYLVNEKKGFIYNTNNKNHIYKFFISRHNNYNLCNKYPFEENNLLGECDIVSLDDQEKNKEELNVKEFCTEGQNSGIEVKIEKSYEKNTDSSCSTKGTLIINSGLGLQPKKSTEICFTNKDLVVLENWLDKNDPFVTELTEKVKKYKVD